MRSGGWIACSTLGNPYNPSHPAAGCGLGWLDASSSDDGLPTTGAGPYGKLETDDSTAALEPWLLYDLTVDLSDPSALGRTDGGLRIWVTRAVTGSDLAEIWYAEVPSIHSIPDVEPAPALIADQPWEEGRVAAPNVVRRGRQLVMFYEGGVVAPAIGRATSDDDGATWDKEVGPVLDGARAPTAVWFDDAWFMFVARGEATADTSDTAIFRARGIDAMVLDPVPTIEPRPDLVSRREHQ